MFDENEENFDEEADVVSESAENEVEAEMERVEDNLEEGAEPAPRPIKIIRGDLADRDEVDLADQDYE